MEQTINVLFEDNHFIAVEKRAGVLVQSDAGGERCLMDDVKEYLKKKYNKPGNVFLGLVHRLDRPVAGIVLFAKTSKGASRISEQFRNHDTVKIYHALVEGTMRQKNGALVSKLAKDERTKKAFVSEGGKEARLEYKTLRFERGVSLLEIRLGTGRFHQIRAQLAEVGHPIVGDKKYGSTKGFGGDGSIALCETNLEFTTATTGERVKLHLNEPEDWFARVS